MSVVPKGILSAEHETFVAMLLRALELESRPL